MPSGSPQNRFPVRESNYLRETSKRIRRLLNKITPITYDDLVQEFFDIIRLHTDENTSPIFVDILFNMAISDSRYCVMYADLCKAYCDLDDDFRVSIVQKCQKSFEHGVEYVKEACEMVEASCIDDENEEKYKEKLKMRGTIRFIGEMYRHNIIADAVTQWCLSHLIKQYELTHYELFIEYSARLIESIGLNHEKRVIANPSGMDLMASYLNKMIDQLDGRKDKFSKRVQFMVINLVELRKNGWIDIRELATIIIPRAVREVRRGR